MNTNGKITICNLFKSQEFGYKIVKLLSVTCLKVENLFLNGKIERWNGNFYIGNYRISFASYCKSKILKLPIPSNEQSLDGNLLPKWKIICIQFKKWYYRLLPIRTVKQVPVNTNRSSLFVMEQRTLLRSNKSLQRSYLRW